MGNRFYSIVRLAAMGLLIVWVLVCAVAWLRAGQPLGFFSWGLLCGSGLLLLGTPLVTRGNRQRWASPMSLRRLLSLLGWMSVLTFFLFDLPVGRGSDSELLAVLGFVWFGLMVLGTVVLALLGSGLQRGWEAFMASRRRG